MKYRTSLYIVFVLLVTGCGSMQPLSTEGSPEFEPSAIPEAVASDEPTVQAALPTWITLPLVNASTGGTFTFADFAGQTVFVEPMATWCTNCRQQLANVRTAREQLGDDVVFVGLSVETNISAEALANYAGNNGFDWLFAVMTPEILAELAATFGRTIANPPSTPHFIIRPDGTTTQLFTGIKSSQQIIDQIRAANGA